MKFGFDAKTVSMVGAAAFATLVVTAAPAGADPAPPPVPAPLPAPAALAAPAPLAAEVPAPAAEVPAPAAATDPAAPPAEGVPHLLSLENLPPGTSEAPVAPSQPRLTYLKDLWHAMQTQEVSGSDALLLLTQRPMTANATPPAGMPASPQAPLPAAPPSGADPLAAPLPAPEAPAVAPPLAP